MTILSSKKLNDLLVGTAFFSTGGGGSIKIAKRIYRKLENKSVVLKSIEEFSKEDLFVTVFGVGSLTNTANPEQCIRRSYLRFLERIKTPVKGIIPVEIGSESVALAFYLANILNVPVVDADFVGGRSSPEVFLETITLFSLSRTPAVVCTPQGKVFFISKIKSARKEEVVFRNIARSAGGNAYVIGYPLRKKQLKSTITTGTISRSIIVGNLLRSGKLEQIKRMYKARALFEGVIDRVEFVQYGGFSKGYIYLSGNKGTAQIFFKNENLILWENNSLVLTCPDSIILLKSNGGPLLNCDLKKGRYVKVLGMPAVPLWRSKKGMKLFNPRLFGFDIKTKLLENRAFYPKKV